MRTFKGWTIVGTLALAAVICALAFAPLADAVCTKIGSGMKCGPGMTETVRINHQVVYTFTACNKVADTAFGKKYCATKNVTNQYGTFATRVGCYRTNANCCANSSW